MPERLNRRNLFIKLTWVAGSLVCGDLLVACVEVEKEQIWIYQGKLKVAQGVVGYPEHRIDSRLQPLIPARHEEFEIENPRIVVGSSINQQDLNMFAINRKQVKGMGDLIFEDNLWVELETNNRKVYFPYSLLPRVGEGALTKVEVVRDPSNREKILRYIKDGLGLIPAAVLR